jgi:hypothetical protein
MRAAIVDTGCSAITMVDQRVCGSVCGGVEMTEEDSTAVEGAGSALLGMGHPRITSPVLASVDTWTFHKNNSI